MFSYLKKHKLEMIFFMEDQIEIEEFLKKLVEVINKKLEKIENKVKELEKKEKIDKSILKVLEGE